MRRVYGVVGWKNSGKTTLVERLIHEITGRGYSLSTVKHAHHGFDVDQPGRDSWRHREAGAREVLVSSRRRWALMAELREAEELPLEAILGRLSPVDLVLVEGYKRDSHAKIEAWRTETGQAPIALDDPTIRAVAGSTRPEGVDLPLFDPEDIAGLATFILGDCGLAAGGAGDG